MMINANEIFNKTGLTTDKKHQSNALQNPKHQIHLQIQLSQQQKTMLKVTELDNPSKIAQQFCKKHQLNHLACTMIEKKIKQGIQIQKNKNKYIPKNYQNKSKPHIRSQSQLSNHKPQNINKNKNIKQLSSSKSPHNTAQNNKQKLQKKPETQPQNSIYERAIEKAKNLEQIRKKRQQQKLKNQQKQLTFKPQINTVSQKIVQFLQNNDIKKCRKQPTPRSEVDQLKQCTFKPQINKISQKILCNKSQRKQQQQQYDKIYKQKNEEQKKISPNDQQLTFKPQINQKSSLKISLPFFKRLQLNLKKKNLQANKQYYQQQQQYSFQPKIGRAPFKQRNKDNQNIWEYLHHGYKKNQSNLNNLSSSNLEQTQLAKQPTITQQYYQNLVQQRIDKVFLTLDSDKDGLISPKYISIQQLPTSCLKFIKPILMQMDEINATLNFSQFRKAIYKLLQHSDQGIKGQFLSTKWLKQYQQQFIFHPVINQRSKNMLCDRSARNQYQHAVIAQKNKQNKIEKFKKLIAQKQMEQCSFKPMLNHSSKIYAEKYAKKLQNKNNRSIDQLIKSFRQQNQSKQNK